MQHYGAPTRALDWSDNPWVALYFALESHPERDGALWFVHVDSVQQFMRRCYGSKHAHEPPGPQYYCLPAGPEHLFFGDVLLGSARKEAQKGMFSWCRRISSDHAVLIASALRDSPARENAFRKLIIPAPMKPTFLEALARIGITKTAVWPDPESRLAQVAARVKTDLLSPPTVPLAVAG
jgi:hypothetical protein